MASFKKTVEPAVVVDDQYDGRVKVYMESEEDVRIFGDHWFSKYQNKLHFASAENEEQPGDGGANAVIRKVGADNERRVPAYGIVDRDILLADERLDLFWEIDDQKFHQTQPYGEHIHVLRRWEVENYLLKAEALSAVMALRKSRPPIPQVTGDNLLNGFAEDLIDLTGLTTFKVGQNQKSPSTEFGRQVSGEALREAISAYLDKDGQQYQDLEEDIAKIRAFTESGADAASQWDQLSRILDGKKALSRICADLSERYEVASLKPWEEMRGPLADKIASLRLIDDELSELVKRISQTNTA